jgi:hypothetical protein
MRCLGRLVFLVVLLVLAGVAWLFRDDLRRWIDARLHPAAAAARIGHPSTEALTAAMTKLSALQGPRRDSVVLTADEMATLIVRGTNFLPGAVRDSLTVELEDRAIRIRTVVDSARIPATLRDLIPGRRAYEEVTVRGDLTPVHAGLAELELRHVAVRGIPLPSDVVGRIATQITGHGSEGRLEIVLPEVVGGFRVRPDGVAVYRQGARR